MMTDAGDVSWVRMLLAFTFVLGLLGILAAVLKYLSLRGFALPGKAQTARRLRTVESLPLDARRRLVIVACDGHEHLLLLGGNEDIVVASNLPSSTAPQ